MVELTRIVELADAAEHVDTVSEWLVSEWPDGATSHVARRSRLLETGHRPPALLAVSEGAPQGVLDFARFVRAGEQSASLFIDALYVCPAARGLGIATALLAAGVTAAAAFDRRLFVQTALTGWYERRGFTLVQLGDAAGLFVLARDLAP